MKRHEQPAPLDWRRGPETRPDGPRWSRCGEGAARLQGLAPPRPKKSTDSARAFPDGARLPGGARLAIPSANNGFFKQDAIARVQEKCDETGSGAVSLLVETERTSPST